MKKTKRNKILLGASIGLVLVSGLTIGFSSWIIGLDKTTDTDTLTVQIDTVENQTKYLDVALNDNSISIAETAIENKNNGIYVTQEDGLTPDFNITFSSFDVILSNSLTGAPTKVVMTWTINDIKPVYTYTGETIDSLLGRSKDTTYTYIDLVKSEFILSEDFTSNQDIDGYTIYSLTNKTISFEWGTLFSDNSDEGIDSPSEFYSNKITGAIGDGTTKLENQLKIMNEANKELDAMHSAFYDNDSSQAKTITIKVELQ